MGLPLGPTLANTFLVNFENNWSQNDPYDYRPRYYRRYVDDIFVLFTSPEHVEAVRNFVLVDIITYHWQLKMKSKTECSFLMYRLFVKIKHLPLLSTINLPLVEFIHILIAFCHLPISFAQFAHSFIDSLNMVK